MPEMPGLEQNANFQFPENKVASNYEAQVEKVSSLAEQAAKRAVEAVQSNYPDYKISLERIGSHLEFSVQKQIGGTNIGEPFVFGDGPRIPLIGDPDAAAQFTNSLEAVRAPSFQKRLEAGIEETIKKNK